MNIFYLMSIMQIMPKRQYADDCLMHKYNNVVYCILFKYTKISLNIIKNVNKSNNKTQYNIHYIKNIIVIMFAMINYLKLTTTITALFIVTVMTVGTMSNVSGQQNATGIADTTNNNGVPDAAVGGSSGTNSSIGGNTSDIMETINVTNSGEDNGDKFQ
jgi:hypothetical protein